MLTILLVLAIGDISGECVSVKDGDTIVVVVEKDGQKQPITVRLAKIDAPEKGQPFRTEAKKHLSSLVFGKYVNVIETSHDRYGRVVGTVLCDGDVCEAMVADGFAWQYRKYDQSETLAKYESSARLLKRGLWAGEEPTEPWRWRRLGRTSTTR